MRLSAWFASATRGRPQFGVVTQSEHRAEGPALEAGLGAGARVDADVGLHLRRDPQRNAPGPRRLLALRRTLTLRAIHESFPVARPCFLHYTLHLPGVYRSGCPLSARRFTKRAPERRLHGSPADGVPAV